LRGGEEVGTPAFWGVAQKIRSEGPQHSVRISQPFRLSAHEVTVGQFKAFVEAMAYKTEAETDGSGGTGQVEAGGRWDWKKGPEFNWRNPGYPQTDRHPVVNVTWNDIVAFCEWLSQEESSIYLLPTEAQWEYACRGGSTTLWCSGDNKEGLREYAWFATTEGGGTKPVGQKLPSGFGVFDMCGNVWEWCSDWYSPDYYASCPVDNPDGPSSGTDRVMRGGGFPDQPWCVRPAYRTKYPPSYRAANGVGFRPVMLIDPANPPKPSPQ